jgi:hypothetical protein
VRLPVDPVRICADPRVADLVAGEGDRLGREQVGVVGRRAHTLIVSENGPGKGRHCRLCRYWSVGQRLSIVSWLICFIRSFWDA